MNWIKSIKKRSRLCKSKIFNLIPLQLCFNAFHKRNDYKRFSKSLYRQLKDAIKDENIKVLKKYKDNSPFNIQDIIAIAKEIEITKDGKIYIYILPLTTVNLKYKYFDMDCEFIDKEDDFSVVAKINHLFIKEEFTGRHKSETWGKNWLMGKN